MCRATQKADDFGQPLQDQHAKEGKDKTVEFVCKFSRPSTESKWMFDGQVRDANDQIRNPDSPGRVPQISDEFQTLSVKVLAPKKISSSKQFQSTKLFTSCRALPSLWTGTSVPALDLVKPLVEAKRFFQMSIDETCSIEQVF